MIRVVDLKPDDDAAIAQAATILNTAFRGPWPAAWPTLDDALAELAEMFAPDRICRVAKDDDGAVVGLIGGISGYNGRVWELHPLAVRVDRQHHGIGRTLVLDLEVQVKSRGGLTITLGTDDEDDATTLSNVDLYQDLWDKVRSIRNLKGHPFEFYQKVGYTIIGVVPDANGWGKPDIIMGKRVG
jgi:aminoglycoside 6'-N-acetyltransferase I